MTMGMRLQPMECKQERPRLYKNMTENKSIRFQFAPLKIRFAVNEEHWYHAVIIVVFTLKVSLFHH